MRAIEEWRGRTDDSAIPDRVKLRVHLRCGGKCQACGRKIDHRNPAAYDHIVPLADSGGHRENNLQVVCNFPCHQVKSAEEAEQRAKLRRVQKKTAGIKRKAKGRPMAGTKASGLRRRFDGTVEKW